MLEKFEVRRKNKRHEHLTANERFGASGAVTRLKVCANLEVLRPSERQWKPRLPQAAGRCTPAVRMLLKSEFLTVEKQSFERYLEFERFMEIIVP